MSKLGSIMNNEFNYRADMWVCIVQEALRQNTNVATTITIANTVLAEYDKNFKTKDSE